MFKKFFSITTIIIILAMTTQIVVYSADKVTKNTNVQKEEITLSPQKTDYKQTNALDLVNNPKKYLDKKIKIVAKFDKFSVLGLDYPPVKRESKKYISFLIKREDVKNANIPLSELKLILKRDYAEKELVNLDTNDEIEIYGTVISAALNDPWVDVEKIVILTAKQKNTEKDASKTDTTNKKN